MKTQLMKTGLCPAVLVACFVWAGPALATFEVPDSCRFGTGTYAGDLAGNGSDAGWTTTTGLDRIDKVFVSMENQLARVYADSITSSAAADLVLQDDGSFTGEAYHNFTGNRLQVQGTFANCVMTGTWTLTIIQADNDTYAKDTVLHGTFEIQSAGSGGGGSTVSPCGLLNVVPFSATILGMALMQSRRARRRSRLC